MTWKRPERPPGIFGSPQDPPAEDEVDNALYWLAQHAQATGMAHPSSAPSTPPYSKWLSVPCALRLIGADLDLPSEFNPESIALGWRDCSGALAGSLYDAVRLARSLGTKERETYLDFLHFSFTRSGVWKAVHSLQRFYKLKTMPDFREKLTALDCADKAKTDMLLSYIALETHLDLRDFMPGICEAILENNCDFFRCLPEAIVWQPPAKKSPIDVFAARPQDKRAKVRGVARRYWVSRGLWMLDTARLTRVFPELKGSGPNLTAESRDSLYSEPCYTRSLRGVLSCEKGPQIKTSILACTC